VKDWTFAWADVALADLRNVHWETGARIDAAVHRFAATGEGLRRIVLREGGMERCLLVPPYAVLVTLDRRARIVWVWQVVRYAP
jgi:hypothetical protein